MRTFDGVEIGFVGSVGGPIFDGVIFDLNVIVFIELRSILCFLFFYLLMRSNVLERYEGWLTMKSWCMILIAFELLTMMLDVSRDWHGLARFSMAQMFPTMFGKCWAEKSNSVFQSDGRRLQDALAWSRRVPRGLFEFHLASEEVMHIDLEDAT